MDDSPDPVDITVALPRDQFALLEDLAARLHTTREEVLRRSLTLAGEHWTELLALGEPPPGELGSRYQALHELVGQVLGPARAHHWLTRPNRHLGGENPAALLRTPEGAKRVEDLVEALLGGAVL